MSWGLASLRSGAAILITTGVCARGTAAALPMGGRGIVYLAGVPLVPCSYLAL